MLPFSSESLFPLFGYYNRAIWPAPVAALLLGTVVFILAFRPIAPGGRIAAAVIALAWLWVGAVFHLKYFAALNFAAPVYGVLFIAQGALVFWFGLIRNRLGFSGRRDAPWWAGVGMMAGALALYPLADGFLGPGWPSVRIFGVTPAPTIPITFGWFLATGTRRPWVLLAIPTSASLVEAYTAFVLRIPHDATVPLAAAATFALCLRRNPTGSSCP